MALVHSRIGRVFYTDSSKDGALGTTYKLHTLTALNHHFDVYRCMLPDTADCSVSCGSDGTSNVSTDQHDLPTSLT